MFKGKPSYQSAHDNVKALWGPARNYPCVKCPEQAAHWAYDWCDNTRENYSLWPEFYMPLCQRCHIRYDKTTASHRNRRGRAFRPRNDVVPKTPKTEWEWELYRRQQIKNQRADQRKVSEKSA